MKKLFLLLTFCTAALCVSASNRYVSPTGDNGDGKSWEHALQSVATALSGRGVGDTVFVAEGVYLEQVSIGDGVTLLGGYDAGSGVRDPELYESVLDGTGLTKWILVKYGGNADNTITIDGMVFQNANHSEWGGAAIYCRGNMVISNCVFRNNTSGSKAGAIFVDETSAGSTPLVPAVIRGCLFENCSNTLSEQAAAISCESAGAFVVENCIFRGCKGAVVISSNAETTVRNCVLHNNQADYNGCLYGAGTFINNTVCNNTGTRYAGSRISGKGYNNVFWGNTTTYSNINFIAAGSNNVGDAGKETACFSNLTLAADNNNPAGPNFRNPTGFAGLPKTDAEKIAVKDADFGITAASTALVDAGIATQAPATDINGVDRPKGNGVDVGAYEYDPAAVHIDVTGVNIVQDSIEIIVGRTGTLVAQIEPADADNKRVTWSIDNPAIASIQNGKITAIAEGRTIARVETAEGHFTDAAVVIVVPVPPVKYPQEVLDAEEAYKMEDYTIPSYIRFLVPKTAAKIDSLNPDNEELLPKIAAYLDTMQMMIDELQPKEMPYNQIATFNGDPATHMGFCWMTNAGITDGVVQLIPSENATAEDFETCDCVFTIPATPTATIPLHYTPIQNTESPKYDICTAAGLPRNTKFEYVSHKALAENLTPNTAYSWRVGYDGHWSEIGHFITKNEDLGNFSFLYMTDSHIHNAEYIEQANQCAKAVAKNEHDVKFCVFPGDFVETGDETNSEWQWERWFEGAMRPALNSMAFVPTGGNHDVSANRNYDYHFNTDHNFYEIATTKPQFHGVTYSFVYGDVLFLVYSLEDWWRASGTSEEGMQSPYLSTDVRNWFLDQIEKYPNTKYRVTLTHKNLFSGADHHLDSDAPLLRAMMLPVLKECGIDLAIQGHDHCYEVIGPIGATETANVVVVPGSVTDTVRVRPEDNTKWGNSDNKTGLEGGTFTTDDGTLYFIGATCGRKRYEPKSRATLDSQYSADPADWFDWAHHNVPNYFSLFTSKFGQPGTPSYSRFNVSSECIEIVTYKTDENGDKVVFNTIQVKNNRPSSLPDAIDNIQTDQTEQSEKVIVNGQLFIKKNGMMFNVIGQKIAQ